MKTNMHLRASTQLFGRAKQLRLHPTKAEEKLWQYLRASQTGYKYRRQHPIANYVVDFYSYALKLAIEVDGEIHAEQFKQMEDEDKQNSLETHGLTVIRFTNDEVLNHIESVMEEIYRMQELIVANKSYDAEED